MLPGLPEHTCAANWIAACNIAYVSGSMTCFCICIALQHRSCDAYHAAGSTTRKQPKAFSMLLRQLQEMCVPCFAWAMLCLQVSRSMTPRKPSSRLWHVHACLTMQLCCPRSASTWASVWKLKVSCRWHASTTGATLTVTLRLLSALGN